MAAGVQHISNLGLTLAFIPVAVVIGVMFKWSLNAGNALYALIRMLAQLLLVGYILTTIFAASQAWIVLLVTLVMVTAASWIALGTVKEKRKTLFIRTFIAIACGGGLTLALITQLVIELHPWYEPRYLIPLAGMIFANSMNSVSLAAERFHAEQQRGVGFLEARNKGFHAAFIPVINSLFAVGLVSLPGMMTGQILSGVSPIVAAHYQIVVMCMIFGSTGLSTALFLTLSKNSWSQMSAD